MRTIAGTAWSVEDTREYILARAAADERGCWIWQKATDRNGYGYAKVPKHARLTSASPSRKAHRLAYEAFVGPIPKGSGYHGTCVLHKCDVPACCNMDHLRLGTNDDNMADMVAKGRQARGERNWRAKLTDDDVREVRRRLAAGELQRAIAAEMGISQTSVSKVQRGVRWAHVEGPCWARSGVGEGNGAAKLTEAKVVEIRRRLAAGEFQRVIASDMGVVQSLISQIKRGRIWAHLTEGDDVLRREFPGAIIAPADEGPRSATSTKGAES